MDSADPLEVVMDSADPLEVAFNAWKKEQPILGRGAYDKEDEDSVTYYQARCWEAWKAFEAGWNARENHNDR